MQPTLLIHLHRPAKSDEWRECNSQKFLVCANMDTTKQRQYMFISADFRILLELLEFVEMVQSKSQQNKTKHSLDLCSIGQYVEAFWCVIWVHAFFWRKFLILKTSICRNFWIFFWSSPPPSQSEAGQEVPLEYEGAPSQTEGYGFSTGKFWPKPSLIGRSSNFQINYH